LKDANGFVARLHRHHKPVVGHKFSLAANRDAQIVGVVIVGRPVARMRDDGLTLKSRACAPTAAKMLVVSFMVRRRGLLLRSVINGLGPTFSPMNPAHL
jgi:hypothetical protein